MKLLARIILSLASNAVAILAANYFLDGFVFSGSFIDLMIAAGILTAINIFVRPIVKLLLGPFVVLTFGLILLAMNVGAIYLLDFFSETININGLIPLAISALVIWAVNFFINFSAKALYK